MEAVSSLPHSQELGKCLYPEPDLSSLISPPLTLSFQVASLPQVSSPKTLYALLLSPIRVICHAHPIILVLITQILFAKEYRPYSVSLRNNNNNNNNNTSFTYISTG